MMSRQPKQLQVLHPGNRSEFLLFSAANSKIAMEKLPEFYPDSDDTYLLIDSLKKDLESRSARKTDGLITIEVGPGGGLVSRSFLELTTKLGINVFHLAVDVNIHAGIETKTQTESIALCDCIIGDTLTWARPDFQADIIFNNPPYVPSSPINRARDIRASYAGGELGREFIDDLIPIVSKRLKSDGVFYLLLEKRNNPEQVCQIALEQYSMNSVLIMERKIPGEHLYVYRFTLS